LLCVVDKVEADRLKEMTELLSGLSSFVKVDKLTKVRDSSREEGGVFLTVCRLLRNGGDKLKKRIPV